MSAFGPVTQVGVEGTGGDGAGLARYLTLTLSRVVSHGTPKLAHVNAVVEVEKAVRAGQSLRPPARLERAACG
jgi:hypothetical protein